MAHVEKYQKRIKQRDFSSSFVFFPRMAPCKSGYNLFLIAEYYFFEETVSIRFGSPLHAKEN